jgi:hypothetical protein
MPRGPRGFPAMVQKLRPPAGIQKGEHEVGRTGFAAGAAGHDKEAQGNAQ